MPTTDPFHVLGLHPGAPREEVRRAYRKLAMRWHPDRNQHAKGAEERFKHIKAAYEIAIDEAAYGAWRAGRAFASAAANASANASAKPAGHHAASHTAHDEAATETVAPIEQVLSLSLEEAAFGCRRQVSVERPVHCPACAGRGHVSLAHSMPCSRCMGVGRLSSRSGASAKMDECPDCKGRGYVRDARCEDCGGRGKAIVQTVFEVRVPAGLKDGETLRLARAGGSVLLRITHLPHELFTLDGDDLHCTVPVSVLDLMAGGEIEVPTLDGSFWMLLPALPFSGEVRLRGKGFPKRKGGVAGDLVVSCQPVFPRNLSNAEQLQLQQLAATLARNPASRTPELHDWKRRMDQRKMTAGKSRK